jgi:hypothetical protein
MLNEIKSLAHNKYVLFGGVALVGLLGYMYMRGGSSGDSADATADSSNIPQWPASMVFGGVGTAGGGGTNLSDSGGMTAGDQALIALENSKLDLEKYRINTDNEYKILDRKLSDQEKMAENARLTSQQTLFWNNKNLNDITDTFLSFVKDHPTVKHFHTTIDGHVINLDIPGGKPVVKPPVKKPPIIVKDHVGGQHIVKDRIDRNPKPMHPPPRPGLRMLH